MKKISLVLCTLALVLVLPGGAAAYGNISVSSSPAGAQVFLDSIDKGVTPLTLANISVGSHNLLLQKAGYQNYLTSVNVPEGDSATVSATLIAATPAPVITGISPSSGYDTSIITGVTVSGSGFSTSGAGVTLTRSGETNISGTVTSRSASAIVASFGITGKAAGYWNVVVTNPDGQSAALANGFEIKNPGTAPALTSITPEYGIVNSTVTITSLAGSNFMSTAALRLKRAGYNDIPGTAVSVVSSTRITGVFDLYGRTPGTYEVCVLNDGTTPTCGLAFTLYADASAANGSIYVVSSPSGANIYLDSRYQGETPLTLYEILPGSYKVLLQRAGYLDWSDRITVTADNRTYVTARMTARGAETTTGTTVTTKPVTTVKTTVKSTVKIPTPWPTYTPAPASPAGTWAILAALVTGLVLLRKW